MDAQRFLAIALIIGGALGLAYGGFTYTRETHHVDVASLHMAVDEKQHVNIPVWVGVGAVVVGGLLLAISKKS